MTGLNLLGEDTPLFGDAVSGLEDPTWDSPDNWLADAAPQSSVAELGEALPSTRNEPNTVEAPPGAAIAGGSTATAIDAAMGWLGSTYDWGGNGYDGRGVDCSGLVYNAFKRAGYNIQRYRAVDYGQMGVAVDQESARPGDIVYFDNPSSDTDHVGIYLGNGKFIESPSRGQQVKISSLRSGAQIRRIFPATGSSDLQVDAAGRQQYFAPDGEVYTGGRADGPQGDPLDLIDSLDEAALRVLEQDPDLELGEVPTGAAPVEEAGGDSMATLLNALSGQESGGDYSVVNSYGAIGKYQVLSSNVGSWSQQVLGHTVSPAQFRNSPELQERIVRGIFGGYVRKYGVRGALATWYSGKPHRHNDYSRLRNGSGPSVGDYVDQVLARMR